MEPLQSENCLPTLGLMLDPKSSTTNSNTAKDGVMSTQIEKLADVFNELIAQQVVRELNARVDLNLEIGERLVALEAKTHHFTFKKLDDLQAEVQSLRNCNAVNIQAMRTQQTKIDNLENILARLEVISLNKTQVESIVDSAFREIDIDYKIERAIQECDLFEAVERALGDVDFTDYGLLTEPALIEFLNDRVRVTTE